MLYIQKLNFSLWLCFLVTSLSALYNKTDIHLHDYLHNFGRLFFMQTIYSWKQRAIALIHIFPLCSLQEACQELPSWCEQVSNSSDVYAFSFSNEKLHLRWLQAIK